MAGRYKNIVFLEFVGYDSCFPGVTDVLKVFRKAGHHCPDTPITQFQSWSLSVCFHVVAWCDGCDLLFGWFLIPMQQMRIAERLAAELEAGGSCPVGSAC